MNCQRLTSGTPNTVKPTAAADQRTRAAVDRSAEPSSL